MGTLLQKSIKKTLFIILACYLMFLLFKPDQVHAAVSLNYNSSPPTSNRVSDSYCSGAMPECWNSEAVGVTGCGTPCTGGSSWTKYKYDSCYINPLGEPGDYLAWLPPVSVVYSTADKCSNGAAFPPPEPYLRAGSCDGSIGGKYKTCCTNTSPSLVTTGSCQAVTPYSGAPYPPYDGVCPAGTTAKFCGFGGYPACGQPACGPLPTPAPTATPTPTPTPTPAPGCQCTYPQTCTTGSGQAGYQTCQGVYSGSTCVWDSSGSCSPNCNTCTPGTPPPTSTPTPTATPTPPPGSNQPCGSCADGGGGCPSGQTTCYAGGINMGCRPRSSCFVDAGNVCQWDPTNCTDNPPGSGGGNGTCIRTANSHWWGTPPESCIWSQRFWSPNVPSGPNNCAVEPPAGAPQAQFDCHNNVRYEANCDPPFPNGCMRAPGVPCTNADYNCGNACPIETIANCFCDPQCSASGPIWTTGKINNAVEFRGISYVELPQGFMDFTGGMTVELWAYPTHTGLWPRFIDFGNGPNSNNILFARRGASGSPTNDLVFEVYNDTKSGGQVIAPDVIQTGQWQHFAATIDSSGNVVLYKNGNQIQTGKTSVPNKVPRANNFIGKSNWTDDYYGGKMDEVRVYNKALTIGEIKQHYNNGTFPDDTAGLIGYWKFDENSGIVAYDSSGNNNNGLLKPNPDPFIYFNPAAPELKKSFYIAVESNTGYLNISLSGTDPTGTTGFFHWVGNYEKNTNKTSPIGQTMKYQWLWAVNSATGGTYTFTFGVNHGTPCGGNSSGDIGTNYNCAQNTITIAVPPISPWIQVVGGDVHSNGIINAPGGP